MERKVYSLEEHGIDIDAIDRDALYILEKLSTAGYTAYLVGGSVRDLLLGQTPKDFDISTSARPEEIRRLFRNCLLIGRRFRLAHIRFGRKVIEVSTFRKGDNEDDTLIVRDNEWGDPEEDVMRRDFTINGLFYDPIKQEVIDYVDGYIDAGKRQLKTIGKPYIRFKQDPVRMIRLLKFQARFGLEIDPEVKIALLECRGEILKSSQARILEEILRMLESGSSSVFIKLMHEYGFLDLLTPALSSFLHLPDGSKLHDYLKEIDRSVKETQKALHRDLLMAALIFPILEYAIRVHYVERDKPVGVGEIQNLCFDIFDEVFHPFFLVPRRLKCEVAAVLAFQYKLTPLEGKKLLRHPRILTHGDFIHALGFLELRACVQSDLQAQVQLWQEAHTQTRSKKHESQNV